jgi:glutathione S-transferase
MFLIGQYDSPFVRRVAVALHCYALPYEHRPWSTFGDAEKIAPYNPLLRVPVLVLDDGEALIESSAILDWMDEQAGAERALLPAQGEARRQALHRIALATGAADKGVALFYSGVFHDKASPDYVARLQGQIAAALAELDREAGERAGAWWGGERPEHDDIALACAARFLSEAHAAFYAGLDVPHVRDHCARAEALPEFAAVVQAFVGPGG